MGVRVIQALVQNSVTNFDFKFHPGSSRGLPRLPDLPGMYRVGNNSCTTNCNKGFKSPCTNFKIYRPGFHNRKNTKLPCLVFVRCLSCFREMRAKYAQRCSPFF